MNKELSKNLRSKKILNKIMRKRGQSGWDISIMIILFVMILLLIIWFLFRRYGGLSG